MLEITWNRFCMMHYVKPGFPDLLRSGQPYEMSEAKPETSRTAGLSVTNRENPVLHRIVQYLPGICPTHCLTNQPERTRSTCVPVFFNRLSGLVSHIVAITIYMAPTEQKLWVAGMRVEKRRNNNSSVSISDNWHGAQELAGDRIIVRFICLHIAAKTGPGHCNQTNWGCWTRWRETWGPMDQGQPPVHYVGGKPVTTLWSSFPACCIRRSWRISWFIYALCR